MQAAGVPTARHIVLTSLADVEAAVDDLGGACVVKADGLAAGKGVVVAGDRDEAIAAARSFLSGEAHGSAGATVVVEELLVGEEVSLLALCDGLSAQPLAARARLQAHRRRRQRPEHRRHGRHGAGPGTDAGGGRAASACWRTSRCCSSWSAAAPASPAASTRA